jgi:hypothetical protein
MVVHRGFHVFFSDCVQNGFIWDVKTLKQFHEIFELRLGDITEMDCLHIRRVDKLVSIWQFVNLSTLF